MFCPYCGDEATKVFDSRSDGQVRTRKRRCHGCGSAFSTTERVTSDSFVVRKRDGKTEPFSKAKLRRGIARAISTINVSPSDVDAFVERVSRTLRPGAPGVPIPSTEIGWAVLQELHDSKAITDVARIRYAIVFLGRSGGKSSTQRLRGFLDWLSDAYGPSYVEASIGTPSRVLKRGGRTESFRLEKIERSVISASKGWGSAAEGRSNAIEIACSAKRELAGQSLVTSQQIAAEVLKQLRKTDAMAYLRFASEAKGYRSVADFWMDVAGLDES